jgi:predicted amidophosphoribosyltransferase
VPVRTAIGAPLVDAWTALSELVLPAGCAGCAADRTPLRHGVCSRCVAAVQGLRPRQVRPSPAPPGLPPCAALGGYDGVLRELILAYKERGRHGLARPLGALLAEVVAASLDGGRGAAVPVHLVPVPSTAQAARQRHGDHLWRLARHTAARLRQAGWSVSVARPLRALPRPDSVALDAAGRATAAASAFQIRPGRPLASLAAASGVTATVVLDDLVTTGVTLAAVTGRLAEIGVEVRAAAVLAATARRHPPAS